MQDKTFVDLLWLYHVVSGIALDLINHEVVVPGTIKRSFFFDWIIIRSIILEFNLFSKILNKSHMALLFVFVILL
jgi:hypothetical protein